MVEKLPSFRSEQFQQFLRPVKRSCALHALKIIDKPHGQLADYIQTNKYSGAAVRIQERLRSRGLCGISERLE
jgi:hypothetical protein